MRLNGHRFVIKHISYPKSIFLEKISVKRRLNEKTIRDHQYSTTKIYIFIKNLKSSRS